MPLLNRSHGRAAFVFIFITVTLDMLALGIMVPVLPKLILSFEGGAMARAATLTGVFAFVWAFMQFVFSPVLGSLSDRFGRRPVVLLSNLGLGLDYLVMAVAPSVGWLFLGRVVSGITGATYPTASAYVADTTPPEKRAGHFGMLGAAFGLGFIVGPAVGGLLGSIDLRLPFWAASGLSLVNFAYGFLVLPESLPPERRTRFEWKVANPVGALQLLRRKRALLGLAGAIFLYYVAHEAMPNLFVLYTDYRYGWGEKAVGYALALVGVSSTIVSGFLVGRVVGRLGERRALMVGLAFGIAAFLVDGLAPTGGLFLLGIPLMALWAFAAPSLQSLMTGLVEPNEQGRLQGALNSLRGIAMMIGPLLFTQVFAAAVAKNRALHLPGLPFLMGGVLLLGAMGLGMIHARSAEAALEASEEPQTVTATPLDSSA